MPNENQLTVDIGKTTDGGTPVTTALAIGGNNGTNFQILKVNSDGEAVVRLSEGNIEIGDVNVGDVDIASASYEYAADSAHANTNTGVLQLAVRNDTLATLVGADNDYAPLQVANNGSLYVAVSETVSTSSVQTVMVTGQATVATGTAAAIASTQTLQNGITVVADSSNSALVFCGVDGVTVSNGFPLAAGAGFTFSLNQADNLFAISGSASQKLNYVAM